MPSSRQLQDIANIVTIISGIFTVLGFIVAILAWLIPRDRLGKFWNKWRDRVLKGAGVFVVVSGVIFLWRKGWLSWLQAPITLPAWSLILLVVLLLVFHLVGKRLIKPSRRERFGGALLQRIAFDYSDSPEVHGWEIQPGDYPRPTFKFIRYHLFGKAIEIESVFECPMKYDVDLAARSGSLIEFAAKYQAEQSIIYACLIVQDQDGSEPKLVWLAFPDREGPPTPHPASTGEYEFPVKPTRLVGNWLRFRVDLEEAVRQTFGERDGSVFRALKGFQLRDSMSLAYISIFKPEATD